MWKAPTVAASEARRSRSAKARAALSEPQGRVLKREKLMDPALAEAEQNVQLCARERLAFGRSLNFDEAAGVGHRKVHVDLGPAVLLVGKVETCDPAYASDR